MFSYILSAQIQTDFCSLLDSLLNCRAKSYDCNFTCSWRDSRFTAVRLGLGHDWWGLKIHVCADRGYGRFAHQRLWFGLNSPAVKVSVRVGGKPAAAAMLGNSSLFCLIRCPLMLRKVPRWSWRLRPSTRFTSSAGPRRSTSETSVS